ncbi:MAG TPA: hypothetical protein VFX57_02840 [Sulfuricurvum sp.]|nr:hypothetical protein [Sulfuricurvum sp.]
MKYWIIVIFAFVVSFSALSAPLLAHQAETSVAASVEISAEKMDTSESSDSYDESYLHVVRSSHNPFFKSISPNSGLIRYPYEQIFTLLKPPESALLS